MATNNRSRSKGIRGGTSAQHAKAGRAGGLAPHVCRGSECTKMAASGSRRKSASTRSRVKASSYFGDEGMHTRKRATASKSRFASLYLDNDSETGSRGGRKAATSRGRAAISKTRSISRGGTRLSSRTTAAKAKRSAARSLFGEETPTRNRAAISKTRSVSRGGTRVSARTTAVKAKRSAARSLFGEETVGTRGRAAISKTRSVSRGGTRVSARTTVAKAGKGRSSAQHEQSWAEMLGGLFGGEEHSNGSRKRTTASRRKTVSRSSRKTVSRSRR